MKVSALVVLGLLMAPVSAAAQGVTDAQIASIVVTANQVDIDALPRQVPRGHAAGRTATDHDYGMDLRGSDDLHVFSFRLPASSFQPCRL